MELTQARLRSILDYDRQSGVFTWKKVSKYHNQLNGKIAGCNRLSRGKLYRHVKINSRPYPAHRLAWFYCRGEWPFLIDHKNGDSLDNRLENLKNATFLENTQNHKTKIKPNGLPTGVRNAHNGRFAARITANKKCYSLGCFATIAEAAKAYRSARKKLHYCPVEEYNENL